VQGILRERDALPLLVLDDSNKIKGYLLHFQYGAERDAYKRIIDIEPDKVYRWGVVSIGGIQANTLVGKSPLRGSSDLEHWDEWDGRSDPYFNEALDEIENILMDNSIYNSDCRPLFRLQMAYSLLWSAIERYASLKFSLGDEVYKKVLQIANEEQFRVALKQNVIISRNVIRTSDLQKYTLDPKDPKKSIKYYYQVRSNITHRGKAVIRDYDTVKSSLEELLAIFRALLANSFKRGESDEASTDN